MEITCGKLYGVNTVFIYVLYTPGWWRDTVVKRRSLDGELSLLHARPSADG